MESKNQSWAGILKTFFLPLCPLLDKLITKERETVANNFYYLLCMHSGKICSLEIHEKYMLHTLNFLFEHKSEVVVGFNFSPKGFCKKCFVFCHELNKTFALYM